MKHLVLIILILIGVAGSAAAQTRPVKVVVFGDSITSGHQIAEEKAFPKMLEQKLLSQGFQTQVINKSVAGQTSGEAVARLDDLLLQSPDIVIIQLGLNDAIRGLSPTQVVYSNLHKILFQLKQRNIGIIILGAVGTETNGKEYARSLDNVYRVLAEHYSATLYPDLLAEIRDRQDLTLADGIHPNEKGVLALVHKISPYVARLVKWRIDLQKFENSSK